MLSHASIWSAIDRLAQRHGLTPSGLARRAGLDPTTFNPSKRTSADGRPRWPSMESIAKILNATEADLADFVDLVDDRRRAHPPALGIGHGEPSALEEAVPVFAMAPSGAPGFFHDGGAPEPAGWPSGPTGQAGQTGQAGPEGAETGGRQGDIAVRVSGDAMLPLYRDGDVVVVSPAQALEPGNRVLVRRVTGSLSAHVFRRRTRTRFEFGAVAPGAPALTLALAEVDWVARIVWASQ